MKTAQINIVGYTKKGRGWGLREGGERAVEVPTTVIGDVVLVEMRKRGEGTLLEVIEASTDRVEPRCPYVGTCGGCNLQQVDYSAQLKTKENAVRTLFASLLDDVSVSAIEPSPEIFSYRGKMEFTFSQNRAGEKFLGLMMLHGKVVDLQECHIATPWMVETLKNIKTWWQKSSLEAYYPPKNTGSLRSVTLREAKNTGEKLVMLTVSGNPDYGISREDINQFCKAVTQLDDVNAPTSVFIQVQQIHKGSPTQFFEMHVAGPDHIKEKLYIDTGNGKEEFTFVISPSSFFQPNTKAAEKLYGLALSLASINQNSIVYDLYCGTATLGIVAAKRAAQVIGIELNPYAVFDAKVNLELNQISNVTLHQGDVGKVLATSNDPKPDLVIIDPPRSGLDSKAIEHILLLQPKEILYVSCNPVTQVENIHVFLSKGYRLKAIQPVDQFPHTPHIENIALLQRDS